ncbi:MAG: diguanylate cyclase [Erysipelotrichaceae bacterium]|nr:diguanylate cyclase [Erysipelotrichaceae bacterium]
MPDNDTIFNKIAEALMIDYTSVYYVNARTNEYYWYSLDPDFHSLTIESDGDDFFVNIARDAKQVVHPDDLHIFLEDMKKEKLLAGLTKGEMQSVEYRLMIDGEPVWHTLRLIRSVDDDDYFILGVINIDKEVKEREENERLSEERSLYTQIAESLALQYDVIYYVDSSSGAYRQYVSNAIYGNLEVAEEGNDFFEESVRNAQLILHPEDKERVLNVLSKDYLISALEDRRQYSIDYRLMIDGKPQYTRLIVMWSSDRIHFIIGVVNITEEIQKENEHIEQLNRANELARRDELTGVRNKNAYQEMERSMQKSIDDGNEGDFGLLVCDLNNLKTVNDTIGHKAGDEYICDACRLICTVFDHSPVFRIGGDEFIVILKNNDLCNREELIGQIKTRSEENRDKKEGPVIACGLGLYDSSSDRKVSEVFERADKNMYENKKKLKGLE